MRAVPAHARSWLELGKPGLSALVVVTAAVGFVLASADPIHVGRLAGLMVGTFLAALGANALNQYRESDRDGRMQRTAGRPLPAQRLTRRQALLFGLLSGAAGTGTLAVGVQPAAGILALAALAIYVLAYTPLKTRTAANTLVGAVVGAIPPLIGWVAARGRLEVGAWILAGVLLVWQIPHFLALAWVYRDDYDRGGFRMLPVVDRAGHLTACVVVVYTLLLVAVSLTLVWVGGLGVLYAGGALVLGAGLVVLGVRLERQRSARAARRVFLGSIAYLPLLLGLMVLDRQVLGARPAAAWLGDRSPEKHAAVADKAEAGLKAAEESAEPRLGPN